jgi:hypothetical protein
LSQRRLNGVADGLMHFAAVPKSHLDLGRVHIHVHPGGVHIDVQGINRLALPVQYTSS